MVKFVAVVLLLGLLHPLILALDNAAATTTRIISDETRSSFSFVAEGSGWQSSRDLKKHGKVKKKHMKKTQMGMHRRRMRKRRIRIMSHSVTEQRTTASPTEIPTAYQLPASVLERLLPFSINGGSEFNDPNSYQSCALARIEARSDVENIIDDAKLVQFYALYCIFCATNGVENTLTIQMGVNVGEWIDMGGWHDDNSDPCLDDWVGITCDMHGRIFAVDLADNNMSGSFPPEIVLLASDGGSGAGNLNLLDIAMNMNLYNNLDSSWVGMLGGNMEFLYYGSTLFAGPIPDLPPNIVEFDCSFTLTEGPLVNGPFEGRRSLSFISLDGNPYNSSVPQVFGTLPSLERLFMAEASLQDTFNYLEGMPAIVEHWADKNPGLRGTISAAVGDLRTLTSLSWTECSLFGQIPQQLGNLENIAEMWLYGNQLGGFIPETFGDLKNLVVLELEDNNLEGAIPSSVCDNVEDGTLQVLGVDCGEVECEDDCCTCCTQDECEALGERLFG